MDKTTSLKIAETICEDLSLYTADADENTERIQRIAAILRDHSTEEPRTERDRTYCEAAVMVQGQLSHCDAYIRTVADSLERGAKSGMTGDANPASGRWIATLP